MPSIDDRIDAFIHDDTALPWLRDIVRSKRVLPLTWDFTVLIALRPDLRLVAVHHDVAPDVAVDVTSPYWRRAALHQGSLRYPELKPLVPARGVDSVTCEACRGTGVFAPRPQMTCVCGGLGWLVPDEDTSPPFAPAP